MLVEDQIRVCLRDSELSEDEKVEQLMTLVRDAVIRTYRRATATTGLDLD